MKSKSNVEYGDQDLPGSNRMALLRQQLTACKQLIKEGNFSAARSGLESTLPQISSEPGEESILREYLQHTILVEALLKNGRMVLSRCNDFLAIFPQTPSILVTRGMAYDNEKRYDMAIKDYQQALSVSAPHQPECRKISKLLVKSKQRLASQSQVAANLQKPVGTGTTLLPTASNLFQSTATFAVDSGSDAAPANTLREADASAGFPSPEASLGAPSDESYTYNILLVGETGSGKTTLLNMLVNFFRGGPEARTKLPSKQDLRVAVPTAYLKATEPEGVQQIERDVRDRGKSQSTKSVGYNFVYQVADGGAVNFHVVDTPGLSDTEGADDANMDNILEKAGSLSHISAIIMVANGSQTRQTITMKNVFTLLRGHLPDAVLKNTLVVLSNCTKLTRNLDPQKLPVRVKPEHLLHMDNSAFSSDPDRWEKAPAHELAAQHAAWGAAMTVINKIVTSVLKLGAASSVAFKELHQLRRNLRSEVHSSLADLRAMQQLQEELEDGSQDPDRTSLVMHTMDLTGIALFEKLNDLDAIQQGQQQKMQQIKDTCKALQMLCSRFNLADELTVVLEGMQVQSRQLDSINARTNANKAIQDLASFIKTLTHEMPQQPVAEEPEYIYDSDADDVSEASDEAGQEADEVDVHIVAEESTSIQFELLDTDSSKAALISTTDPSVTQSPDEIKAVTSEDMAALSQDCAAPQTVPASTVGPAPLQAEQAIAPVTVVSSLQGRVAELSRRMYQKLKVSAPVLGTHQVKQFTEKSKSQTSGKANALPALAHRLHKKLAQTQLELADIKDYRAAAEKRQGLAAAAAVSMAAFTEHRLQVAELYMIGDMQAQAAALLSQIQEVEDEFNTLIMADA